MSVAALYLELTQAGFVLSGDERGLRVEPASRLSGDQRTAIRTSRTELLGVVALAAEVRNLLEELGCGPDHPDHPEGLAAALSNPDDHLMGLRESSRIERGWARRRQGVSP